MFGMHTIVQTKRQWEHLSGPNKGERTAVETSYHASTIEIDERLSRKNSSQITPCHYGWSWMRLQTESPWAAASARADETGFFEHLLRPAHRPPGDL